LQDIAQELTAVRRFDIIIDFASGLPTQDHIHTAVPPGTTVIYSDYDPVVVEYAREILGDAPNVYFFEAEAGRPEELLHRPDVEEILGGRRDVAIVYWGISGFITDEELAHAAQVLYEWSGPNSCWAFNAQGADANPDHPSMKDALHIYDRMGTPGYVRTKEGYLELVKPWRSDPKGLTSLLDWHGIEETELQQEDRDAFGPTGAGYGVFLTK
jgi:hypothetical protein